jgi:hypothetical protein
VLLVVTQPTLLVALQPQPAPAVTVTLPLPPAALKEALVADNAYVHGAPACVTVKSWPAIVRVPLRDVVAVFAATE